MTSSDEGSNPFSPLYMYYQNARSLNNKLLDFTQCSSSSEFDMIAITETWLTDSVFDAELVCDRYSVFRKDRNFSATSTTRGGGVLLAIDNKFSSVRYSLPNEIEKCLPGIDILCVKVTHAQSMLYVFVLYIPPTTSTSDYELLFDYILSMDIVFTRDIIVVGDFNISNYAASLSEGCSSRLVNMLSNFSLLLNLTQYNTVQNQSGRILDMIISNVYCEVVHSEEPFLPEDVHHPALDIYVSSTAVNNGPFSNNCRMNSIPTWNFRRANLIDLYLDFASLEWSSLYSTCDPNVACDIFYNIIFGIFHSRVPTTIPKKHESYPPWFSSQAIRMIKRKLRLLRRYKETKSECLREEIKALRAKIKSDTRRSYEQFKSQMESRIRGDGKLLWNFVNMKKNQRSVPRTMVRDGVEYSTPEDIVAAFASFFSDSYNHCPKGDGNSTTFRDVKDLLHIPSFSVEEVEGTLKKFAPSLTAGPDSFPSFLLRDCAVVFAPPLAHIFNLCLKYETFPDTWKLSKSIPTYKSGDRNGIENYRQIVIICNFAKAFEFLLHDTIFTHVKTAITVRQHGFMKGRSTTTNLFWITQYIADAFDNKLQVDVVYTDLSKAFDRVDHDLLISKLATFGLSNSLIKLFRSYLQNRFQYVSCRGYVSESFPALSGVPQGSVLGPLLFNIYMNDLSSALSIDHLLYADDLKLFTRVEVVEDCMLLQRALDDVQCWCDRNKLSLNVSKCSVMSFGLKKELLTFHYQVGNDVLNRPSTMRDLGVIFDPKLSFVHHIEGVISAAYKTMGFIIRCARDFTSIDAMKQLFLQLVRAKAEYACVVWCPGYKTHIKELEDLQRKYVKYLAFKQTGVYPEIGYPHDILLSMFNLDSLQRRRDMFCLRMLYKLLHDGIDCPYIISRLNFRIPRLNARNALTFELPTPRTNVCKNSPLHHICQLYNESCQLVDIFHCSESDVVAIVDHV